MVSASIHSSTTSPTAAPTEGWEIVIGLEIHAQVASKSKLFSGSATSGDGGPNSRVSFLMQVCLGCCLSLTNIALIKLFGRA